MNFIEKEFSLEEEHKKQVKLLETLKNCVIIAALFDKDDNLKLTLQDGRVINVYHCVYGGVGVEKE